MILVNYSHPLTADGKMILQKMVGASIEEVLIPCELDFNAPLRPQLDALVAAAPAVFHWLIPPTLSVAAGYVTARLSYATSDAMPPQPPPIVVMRHVGMPARYVPVEIV